MEEMLTAVDEVLAEVGADEMPVQIVPNKVDLVDPLRGRRLANRFPGAPEVSARSGEGLDEFGRPWRGSSASGSRRCGC